MTIWTSASRTHKEKHGICVDGIRRTQQVLAKLGLGMESLVTMRTILEELGVSDCVYSFCEVRKGCEDEADRVLRQYMSYILDLTEEYLGVRLYTNGLNKRLAGVSRPALLLEEYNIVNNDYHNEPEPVKRYGYNVYRCMLSPKTDSQAATHAGISLMDGAEVLGKREEVHGKLFAKLQELLV